MQRSSTFSTDRGSPISEPLVIVVVAAEMRIQQLADEGARHDGALVDIERQAAHVDLVDEIGGGFSRRDATLDQVEDLLALGGGDARRRKSLELVGVKMQRFANQECGFRHRIGGAVREHELGLDEAADGVTDVVKQRQQFAGTDLWGFRNGSPALGRYLAAPGRQDFGHQDLVQRAAAASSWSRASIQLAPFGLSSRFQNGALAFR